MINGTRTLISNLGHKVIRRRTRALNNVISLNMRRRHVITTSRPRRVTCHCKITHRTRGLHNIRRRICILPFRCETSDLPLTRAIVKKANGMDALNENRSNRPLPAALLVRHVPCLTIRGRLSIRRTSTQLSRSALCRTCNARMVKHINVTHSIKMLRRRECIKVIRATRRGKCFVHRQISTYRRHVNDLIIRRNCRLNSPNERIIRRANRARIFYLLRMTITIRVMFTCVTIRTRGTRLFLRRFRDLHDEQVTQLREICRHGAPYLHVNEIYARRTREGGRCMSNGYLCILRVQGILFSLCRRECRYFLEVVSCFFYFYGGRCIFLGR